MADGTKPKLTADGNAVITCRTCRQDFDKGCPPIPGQDDRTFQCEGCATNHNRKALAAAAPTVTIGGSK
jgi:hypothetical protein